MKRVLARLRRRPPTAGASLVEYEQRVKHGAAAGDHRGMSGGRWDEIGDLVMKYLCDQGLRRDDRVLDVGCGALRVGVRLVDFLEADHYYGVDLVQEMLDAGYDIELANAGLQRKLSRDHLRTTGDFEVAGLLGEHRCDVALAQSVFSHLPIGHLRLCLDRLAPVMKPGGVFHATLFVVDDPSAWTAPYRHAPGGVTTFPTSDPYHHLWSDVIEATDGLPWSASGPFDIGHPRAQLMARFVRDGD